MPKNSSSFRNASREHLSFIDEVLAFLTAVLLYRLTWLRSRIVIAGSVANYLSEISKFGKPRIFSKRENLWAYMLKNCKLEKEQNIYFEFGVAFSKV